MKFSIHIPTCSRWRSSQPLTICAFVASMAGLVVSAQGQGLAQVSVAGIPPVLPSPLVSDIAMGFEQGRFPMTFIFNSPDRQSSEFVFRVRLEREGEVVLDLTSDATRYTRGVYTYTTLDAEPPITFAATYRQIVDAVGASLGQDLEQTGLLSEGSYTLTVEAVPANPDQLVVSVPGSAAFTVQYLEPPVLMSPAADEVVSDRLPLFTWLPVLGAAPGTPFEYEFLLVEVYPEQEPVQAIEANRPLEELVVQGITTLPYTSDRLPLEAGRRYAWQVTARDADGLVPFTDFGRSEISTFVYAPSTPALARWTYPFSRPAIAFNLADAELTHEGFRVRGYYEGEAGDTPVTALFDDVLLDAGTLEIVSGGVSIIGESAESVGRIESDAARHILVDDTPPSVPFVTARVGAVSARTLLNLTIGPAEDPESGIETVEYRLRDDRLTTQADSPFQWTNVFAEDPAAEAFPGSSYGIELAADVEQLLRDDVLSLEVRLSNGIGLVTKAETRVGAGTDVSPPVVVEPVLTYFGYYHPERPNSLEISDIQVSDRESNIRGIDYRFEGPGGEPGPWISLASPGARTYRTRAAVVELPPIDRDASVVIEFRVTNDAGLATGWSEQIDVDIDETEPVLAGAVTRFVTSESDPRIEILRDAIADYQSGVRNMSYRVTDREDTVRVYVDWTVFPPGPVAEVKRTQLNFTTRRDVRVEIRAQNGAGLEAMFAEAVNVPELSIGDQTPPAVPPITVRVLRSEPGAGTFLEVNVGATSDPETGISRVQYRVEDPLSRTGLTGWTDVSGVSAGMFRGSRETVVVRPPRGATSLRVIVRAVNGAGAASFAARVVSVAVEDTTPPEIESIEVYVQAGRVLAFVDGLADRQSAIERIEYQIAGSAGAPLTDWTEYPLVPVGRSTYGRQLLRVDIPPAATGPQVVFRLRAVNRAGLETVVEETVPLER